MLAVSAVSLLMAAVRAEAEDTNTVELIKQLQQRIDALEKQVRELQTNKEQQEQSIDAKAKQRTDELEQKLNAQERQRQADAAAQEAATKQKSEELDRELKSIAHEQELQRTEADKEKARPTITLGNNGLVVRSADSNFLMNIHGYMQADARFYLEDNTPANDTFLLRRVRPIIEGTVYDRFSYRFMPDFGSGNVSGSSAGNNAILDDAFGNARILPDLQVQIGKFKSPVGLERLQSTAELLFIETGFATEMTPNYDVGAELHNNLFNEPINYAIGIFNGAADGGSDDMDTTDEGKDVAGRIFLQPFLRTQVEPLRRLGFGVGGSAGHHEGALPSYKTPGQLTFFSYTNGVTAQGMQYRVDPQAYYYWGPFGVLGEYIVSSQEVKSTGVKGITPRFDNRAWQVAGSWFLTGEDNSFRSSSRELFVPTHPLDFQGGWGALELVARVQQMSLDKDAFPKFATSASANEATGWGVGLNWYLNSNFRLYIDYEQTSFEGGSKAKGAVTATDEQALLGRMQVSF